MRKRNVPSMPTEIGCVRCGLPGKQKTKPDRAVQSISFSRIIISTASVTRSHTASDHCDKDPAVYVPYHWLDHRIAMVPSYVNGLVGGLSQPTSLALNSG